MKSLPCIRAIQIFGEVVALITEPETYLGVFVNPMVVIKTDGPAVIVPGVEA